MGSKFTWQMSELTLQIFALQRPALTVDEESKYVEFSLL
jgi:hypothetical protein